MENQDDKLAHLQGLVKEFFRYLDRIEESDSGRIFHPVTVSCCRAAWLEPLDRLMAEMKKAAGASSDT